MGGYIRVSQPFVQRLLRSPLLPLLTVTVLGLTAIWPLLTLNSLRTDDGILHLYRLVELDHCLRQGLLFPRWFPDVAFGYGSPFLSFRAPLGYYLAEALHLLGLPFSAALNGTFALALLLSGWTMYLWARDVWGQQRAIVSAVAYMYAPYLLLDALFRANLPESAALALLPLILWAFRRLVVYGGARYFLLSALTYALLTLTHNISTLLFTPLLVLYILFLHIRLSATTSVTLSAITSAAVSAAIPAALALALGLGLGAFFWAPALLEKDLVHLHMAHSTWGNDYHNNFLTLEQILAPPQPHDPALLNPPVRRALGWGQLALAAFGLVMTGLTTLRRRKRKTSEVSQTPEVSSITFWTLAFVVQVALILPSAVALWDRLPLLRFVQFPWRFLGQASLSLAFLSGAALAFTPMKTPGVSQKTKGSIPILLLTLLLCIIPALPDLYPTVGDKPANPTITDLHEFERSTGFIGVDSLGTYLPIQVLRRPTGSPLEAMYRQGRPIERLDPDSLPAGTRIITARYGPVSAEVVIDAPRDFIALWHCFYFPGWRVTVDGKPVPVEATEPEGLMRFPIPAGRHRIAVRFGPTPLRAAATALSLLSALVWLLIAALQVRRFLKRSDDQSTNSQSTIPQSPIRNPQSFRPLIALSLIILLLKVGYLDTHESPIRHSRLIGDELRGVSHPMHLVFGDRLLLLGYDVRPASVPAGGTFVVDMYWKALRPLNAAYQSFVRVEDAEGHWWSPKDHPRPRDYRTPPPTNAWPVDAYARDAYVVQVIPGTPPGQYALEVGMADLATLVPLPVEGGGTQRSIAALTVTRPRRFPTRDEVKPQYPLQATHGPLELWGVNLDREVAQPGEAVLITLFWHALTVMDADYQARLSLVDESGTTMTEAIVPPGGPVYPTTAWTEGEFIRQQTHVRLPVTLESGRYRWQVALLGPAGLPLAPPTDLGKVDVQAPERLWQVPSVQHPMSVDLDGKVFCRGYDLEPAEGHPGDALHLTLYWQAQEVMDDDYHVFVHLVALDGRILAQRDGVPVHWTRPTTGWAPGEVLVDPYELLIPADAPPGEYTLLAGMYDPTTNQRLPVRDASGQVVGDHILLGTVQISR